ncbi:MAG: hypothetical protein LBK00_09240 [Treponema sp.]|nr:hypothetical protein [Treponema sp.]
MYEYDEKDLVFVVVAILLTVICLVSGWVARGVFDGRERNALTASLERHQYELESLRKQLGEAATVIDELEQRIEHGGLLIDDTQGTIQRAIGIGHELEGLDRATGGAVERIRTLLGLGDGGRDAAGDGTVAGAGEQRPP